MGVAAWVSAIDGTQSAFRSSADGQATFHPFGVVGRGYVVPDATAGATARRVQRLATLVSWAVMLVAVAVRPGFLGVLAAGVGAAAVHWLWLRRVVNGWRRAPRLTLRDGMPIEGRAAVLGVWAAIGISAVLVAAETWVMVRDPGKAGQALTGIVFFGACGVLYGRRLHQHRRDAAVRGSGTTTASR